MNWLKLIFTAKSVRLCQSTPADSTGVFERLLLILFVRYQSCPCNCVMAINVLHATYTRMKSFVARLVCWKIENI